MIGKTVFVPPVVKTDSQALGPDPAGGSPSFERVLTSALKEVNRLQIDANDKTAVMVAGGEIEVHEVMLAIQKAELALDLTQSVRNKVVESYQEIMRMQV